MKALIITLGLVLGIVVGSFPSMYRTRPLWWRFFVIIFVSFTIFGALYPPTAGTFIDAVYSGRNPSTANKSIPVNVVFLQEVHSDLQTSLCEFEDCSSQKKHAMVLINKDLVQKFQNSKSIILNIQRDGSDTQFRATSYGSVDPLYTLPFIPGLEERARNMYFHVPMSWVAVWAYLIAMYYSVLYLRTKNIYHDDVAASAAGLGTLFTILATLTGAVWSKFNWGSYWNWDPRQTSIFVLLVIYAAYFALRSSFPNDESKRARLSAVYAIFAFATVPFLIFILPRLMEGLHPGSQNDVNSGPIISSDANALNITKQIIFSASMASFTLIFHWLLSLKVRFSALQREILLKINN